MNNRKSALISCLMLLSGCTFQSSQLDLLLSAFKRSEAPTPRWVASLGTEVRALTPAIEQNRVVFVDGQDTAIVFDGWLISSVTGMGLRTPMTIRDNSGLRYFVQRRREDVMSCGKWVLVSMGLGSQWQQSCVANHEHINVITIDAAGDITKIEQVVSVNGDRLMIERQ